MYRNLGCIAHLCTISLPLAKRLFDVCRTVGFRNSGISIGANGKFTVQLRGCNSLEVPLSLGKNLLMPESYMNFLITVANEKFDKNLIMIERLEKAFEKELALKEP